MKRVMLTYQVEQWKSARWQRDDRFYLCEVKEDLWSNWLVMRQWGGVSSGRWGAKETVCNSFAEAEALFDAVAKRREKRGYVLVEQKTAKEK
ncbi:MAG: WGR domain-containing protein [Symploca sp. SIO2C1]|nr:WGR domain-containing protein [Symploca sp. SIO2C1]